MKRPAKTPACGPISRRRITALLIFEDEGRPISLHEVVQDAGDRMQVLHLDHRLDPKGEVRERYRLHGPGWVLVRPDQVVATRGVGTDFSSLHAHAAEVLRPRLNA
ncbi:MAG: hypothetical protein Q8K93_14340 [Reyranella sp.]|uniref:hypothetical protein n=1 Tax=Reyranella sp. TaxID=1929291 RepID=UPI002731C3F7|nr:hypothetical protein [Reyranella sp.]MDP1963371.1 hypothetical protein [Reyranella sp.]MDP2376110.1 hypothetical protein [Reyranella sp.]